ncbi:serine/threonine-protein kinase [uncultured Halopseudomonas sp.]|uniref:serine/threonine-protein kinase n=1 Tax=uncultured Halopseudomonas sp. TaxID=2901193 RepID=UPI0030EDED71|tara:strand:- start:2560 stop:3534 length:975 start_codon:yes stop_codon:yes gene_type:complete
MIESAQQPSSVLTRLAESHKNPAANDKAMRARELPDLLCKRYKIERLLGVGGMGAVYRAQDLLREQYGDPDPYVAIKTLNEEFAEYPDANALLYTEFALTSRLRHSNVIRLYAFDIDPDSQRAFITMEQLKGPTLDQLLEQHPDGLPWLEFRSIALPLLEALVCAHDMGVLHGDLKPSNVILARDGLRLFDFGLGQPVKGLLNSLPRLSRKRIAAWTPRYAALELLNGEPLTTSSDIYGMACILYELSSGLHPYSRLTAKQAKVMEQDKTLQKPAKLPAHCWPALRTALAFDKEDREIDAQVLLDAFAAPQPGLLKRIIRRRSA